MEISKQQLTVQEIRNDLKDIQYFYSKQRTFESAANIIGQNAIVSKVAKYNEAMCNAPIRLYDIYISLYVNNNTQEALAEDWNCSFENIRRINKQLYDYLQKTLK